jgi:VIT1/CCC1 family predicted Fe2+/Mn2+ transporter
LLPIFDPPFTKHNGGPLQWGRINVTIPAVSVGSLVFLALLGFLGARTGGAAVLKPVLRVTFWGALAMAITASIGAIVGTVV